MNKCSYYVFCAMCAEPKVSETCFDRVDQTLGFCGEECHKAFHKNERVKV